MVMVLFLLGVRQWPCEKEEELGGEGPTTPTREAVVLVVLVVLRFAHSDDPEICTILKS